MNEQPVLVCNECGLDPTDPRATRARRSHAGNRIAHRIWLLFLLVSVVIALPWVQTRIGWKHAESSYTRMTDPRARFTPLINPLVRWRDIEAAAASDPHAITVVRAGLEQAMTDSVSSWNLDLITMRVEMLQNQFHEGGSREHMRKYYDDDTDRWGLRKIRESTTHRWFGWPYNWRTEFENSLIDYEEAVYSSNPMGDDPEPKIDQSFHTMVFWSWEGIVASIAFAWWSGWLVWIVIGRCGVGRVKRTVARWAVVLALLSISLLLGLSPRESISRQVFATALEEVQHSTAGESMRVDELRGAIDDDPGVIHLARDLLGRYDTLDRPNALVGLAVLNPIRTSNYRFSIGYWGAPLVHYTHSERFLFDEEWVPHPVSAGSATKHRLIRISRQGLSLFRPAGKNSNSRYSVSFRFATLLVWLSGAWLLLRSLELGFRPIYRRAQRRREKRGQCIWCRYPIA